MGPSKNAEDRVCDSAELGGVGACPVYLSRVARGQLHGSIRSLLTLTLPITLFIFLTWPGSVLVVTLGNLDKSVSILFLTLAKLIFHRSSQRPFALTIDCFKLTKLPHSVT